MTQVSADAILMLDALLCSPAPPEQPLVAQQTGKAKAGSPSPAKPAPQVSMSISNSMPTPFLPSGE